MADDDRDPAWSLRADEAMTAVVAHGMVNSVSAVLTTILTLRERWEEVPHGTRDRLLDAAAAQCDLVLELLGDLVRGQPRALAAALDELDERGGLA